MNSSRSFLVASLSLVSVFAGLAFAQSPSSQNPKALLEARLDDLMTRLTLDEKIALLGGTGFTTQPIPRLGIPALAMADAGQGVRGGPGGTLGPATAFPCGVAMASTWNPSLVGRIGAQIGIEAKNKGTGVGMMLGPAVNIHRSPLGGRNGEYFSEDPFLAGQLAVGYIRGMQNTGTLACIKHFACNNQETERGSINAVVSERALREIYLPAFEAGVKQGGVAAVMSSYNKVNGAHASANDYLLGEVLKGDWGFDGVVMSDWGGVHETVGPIRAGNDLEMPTGANLSSAKVKDALARGLVTQAQIDANVRRILRTVLRSGAVDNPTKPNPALFGSAASRDVALAGAQEGLILLKNERATLPLDAARLRSIALIGPSGDEFQVGAQGSPYVEPLQRVTPLQAIRERVGAGVQVRALFGLREGALFPPGLVASGATAGFAGEYFPNRELKGEPTVRRTDANIAFSGAPPGLGANNWSARWTGTLTARKSGPTTFLLRSDDGARLFLDGKKIIDNWRDQAANTASATVELVAGQRYELRVEYYQNAGAALGRLTWIEPGTDAFSAAEEAARTSDVAIVFASTQGEEGEGTDRPLMALPGDQNELIARITKANPRTIVVLNNGTPVSMPWLAQTPALLEAWFPGEQGGRALSQVLFGDINPSGHLPTTLGARREDYPDFPNFPGKNGQVRYEEGLYVGYRAFDKRSIAPLFPFGYGLSYTTFRLDRLRLSSPTLAPDGRLLARVRVSNTGPRAGAQVVQLYVRDLHPQVDKPVRELKGFAKVFLAPRESRVVEIGLLPRDFAWYDVSAKGWRTNEGRYSIEVGASSRDIAQTASVQVASWFAPVRAK